MATHHMFVLAIEAEPSVAEELVTEIETLVALRGYAPVPCMWAPDPDTVAEGLGVDFGEVEIHDMNPAHP